MPAVVSSTKTKETFDRTLDPDAPNDSPDPTNATAEQTWQVLFAAGPDGQPASAFTFAEVEAAIPQIGAPLPGVPRCLVRKVRCERIDPVTASAQVAFDTKAGGGGSLPANPLSEPKRYSYGGGSETEPFFFDVEDQPMATSAGEELADLPVRLRPVGTITIEQHVANYDDGSAANVEGGINGGTVSIRGQGYAEGTLRIDKISASGPAKGADGTTYWKQTTAISKNTKGFDRLFEDRGLYQLDADGKQVAIRDANGHAVRTPYPLDGLGKALAIPTTPPAQIVRKPYERISFGGWI